MHDMLGDPTAMLHQMYVMFWYRNNNMISMGKPGLCKWSRKDSSDRLWPSTEGNT